MDSDADRIDLIDRLGACDSCAVSDAMDNLGLNGVVLGLRPTAPMHERLVGRVITVRVRPRSDAQPASHLGSRAIMAASPGDVIVVDHRGRCDVSAWGGLLSLAARRRGVSGVIVDGACRDVAEAEELGLPVFSRSVVPITARGRVVEESFNEPIVVGGVAVEPGDLVVGDRDGVVFVPRVRAGDVIARAERIVSRERQMAEALEAGESVVDVMHDTRFDIDGM